jgi:hypothetical protein
LTDGDGTAHGYGTMAEGVTTGTTPVPDAEADYAVRHPLRPLVLAGLVTLVAYAGGVVATGFVTRDIVPGAAWWPWIVAECLFLIAWLALVAIMWVRQPDARETVIVWGHASRALTHLSQGFIAWAIRTADRRARKRHGKPPWHYGQQRIAGRVVRP